MQRPVSVMDEVGYATHSLAPVHERCQKAKEKLLLGSVSLTTRVWKTALSK